MFDVAQDAHANCGMHEPFDIVVARSGDGRDGGIDLPWVDCRRWTRRRDWVSSGRSTLVLAERNSSDCESQLAYCDPPPTLRCWWANDGGRPSFSCLMTVALVRVRGALRPPPYNRVGSCSCFCSSSSSSTKVSLRVKSSLSWFVCCCSCCGGVAIVRLLGDESLEAPTGGNRCSICCCCCFAMTGVCLKPTNALFSSLRTLSSSYCLIGRSL